MRVMEHPALSLADLEDFDRYAPKERGEERRFWCPLPACSGKKRDKSHRNLGVNTKTGAWNCHACGATGKLKDFWEERPPERPKDRARKALRRTFEVSRSVPPPPPDPEAAETFATLKAGLRPLAGTAAEDYLESRGIPLAVAQASQLRFHPRWYGRPAVVFPVRDPKGTLIAAQGRHVDGREDPKAHSTPGIGGGVFATAGALEAEIVGIVEGPMDALTLAALGLPTIALMGKNCPEFLPKALAFRTAVLLPDNDQAGRELLARLKAALPLFGTQTREIAFPDGCKDPNAWLQTDPDGLRAALAPYVGASGAETPVETPLARPQGHSGAETGNNPVSHFTAVGKVADNRGAMLRAPEEGPDAIPCHSVIPCKPAAAPSSQTLAEFLQRPFPEGLEGERAAVFFLAEAADFPGLYRAGEYVGAGRRLWERFCRTVRPEWLSLAAEALQARNPEALAGDALLGALGEIHDGERWEEWAGKRMQAAQAYAAALLERHPEVNPAGPVWEAVDARINGAYVDARPALLEEALADLLWVAAGHSPLWLEWLEAVPAPVPTPAEADRRAALLRTAAAVDFPRVSIGPGVYVSGSDWRTFAARATEDQLGAAEAALSGLPESIPDALPLAA